MWTGATSWVNHSFRLPPWCNQLPTSCSPFLSTLTSDPTDSLLTTSDPLLPHAHLFTPALRPGQALPQGSVLLMRSLTQPDT